MGATTAYRVNRSVSEKTVIAPGGFQLPRKEYGNLAECGIKVETEGLAERIAVSLWLFDSGCGIGRWFFCHLRRSVTVSSVV